MARINTRRDLILTAQAAGFPPHVAVKMEAVFGLLPFYCEIPDDEAGAEYALTADANFVSTALIEHLLDGNVANDKDIVAEIWGLCVVPASVKLEGGLNEFLNSLYLHSETGNFKQYIDIGHTVCTGSHTNWHPSHAGTDSVQNFPGFHVVPLLQPLLVDFRAQFTIGTRAAIAFAGSADEPSALMLLGAFYDKRTSEGAGLQQDCTEGTVKNVQEAFGVKADLIGISAIMERMSAPIGD